MKSIQNYLAIEEVVSSNHRSDSVVKVKLGTLRDMFSTIKRAYKAQGVLGFTNDLDPIVNDIGMVSIIRSVAEEDFSSYGPMVVCKVSRKTPDLAWQVEMVFLTPDGDLTLTHSYSLNSIEGRRKFKFQLP